MIDKRRVAAFLVQGVGTEEIAGAVGCDPSYVSQLRDDPEILALMDEEKGKLSARDVEFDDKLARVEEKALDIIERNIGFANPHTALSTFKILNGANRRKSVIQQNNAQAVQVTLVLPVAMIPQYVTNESREIIEVEGRTMLSATPRSIEQLAAARSNEKDAKATPRITAVEQAAARLGALGPVPARAPRKSPLDGFNPSHATVDQL